MDIQNRINQDEEILWKGKKSILKVMVNAFFNAALILLILYGAFVYHFVKCLFPKGWFCQMVILMAVPVGIYLCYVFFVWLSAKCTDYIVTDKAVYIKKGVLTTTIEMKPYIDIAHVKEITTFEDKILHTGSVAFDCWNMQGSRAFGIKDIKEYEKVFAIINEHQQKAFRE